MGRSSLGYGTGYNYLARGIVMSQSAATDAGTSVEFGADNLIANAAIYREHKRLVDAASRYENVDDAIAGLRVAWAALESQVADGAGYTPDSDLGFGSDNAAVIAESLLGVRNTVGATRKMFAALGK